MARKGSGQVEASLRGDLVNAFEDFGEESGSDARENDAQALGAVAGERAGVRAGHIAQLRCGAQDAVARFGSHVRALVHHA